MNYYELIYLQKELKNKLTDYWVEQAITPFKNQLEISIANSEKSFRLIFNASPGNQTLFLDSYRPAKKSNNLNFFEAIYGKPIQDIVLVKYDRIIFLQFSDEEALWFKLFGNKANAFLSKSGQILETFKDVDKIGSDIPTGKNPDFFQLPDGELSVKELVSKLNPLLPRTHLQELSKTHNWSSKSKEEIVLDVERFTAQIEKKPVFRILIDGTVTMLSEEHLPVSTKENKETVNDLVQYRFKNYARTQRLTQKKKEFERALIRQLKRLKSALSNLEKAEKGLEKAELFEKYGHLLMAQAHLPAPDAKTLELEDFYSDGERITIPVNTTLSMVENAEHYYQRSTNSKSSYVEAVQRTPVLRDRLKRLNVMAEELAELEFFDQVRDWERKHRKELESLGFGKVKGKEQNLPFHAIEVDGYNIWIGKNAKSNDKLVQLSHKEDIWMHARGVPGSHLIVRMNNNKNMPNSTFIDKAASFAAFNSKAKGSNLVPVIFTKRKFVRKPKGAAPGAVTVQKEQVTIVEPQNPME